MQEEPKEPYIYQPYGMQDKYYWDTKKIYGVAGCGLFTTIKGITKDQAEKIVEIMKGVDYQAVRAEKDRQIADRDRELRISRALEAKFFPQEAAYEVVKQMDEAGLSNGSHGNSLLGMAKEAIERLKGRDREIASLKAERDRCRELHADLLGQVVKKFPNESRHETAKRYIREREESASISSPKQAFTGGKERG